MEPLNHFGDKTEMQKEKVILEKLNYFISSPQNVMVKYLPQEYFFLITKMRYLQKTRC